MDSRVAGCRQRRDATAGEQLTFDFGSSPDQALTERPLAPIARAPVVRRVKPTPPKIEFIPFPLARRRPLVAKLAAEVAAATTADAGENLLGGRLARLGRGLRRRHISEQTIADELQALEAAVRGELWRTYFGGRASGG